MGIDSLLKNAVKKTVRVFGLDLRKYDLDHSDDLLIQAILRNFQIKTVIDVGANEGQYASGLIDHGYNGKIYSIEPIPSVFLKLQQNARKHAGWTVLNFAMGAVEGELVMNVSENLASSSLFNVTQASLTAEPKTRITHQEKIKMTTIDSFLDGQSREDEIMLKLDIQGYELEALKGARKALEKIKVVQSELSFVPLYEGAPLFQDVVDYLKQREFEIFTIIPGFRNAETGRLLQADGIFVRK